MIALPALGVFLGVAVLIALSYAYRNSLGAVLRLLAKVFIDATWNGPLGIHIGFAFLGNLILKLDNGIREAMAAGIQGGEWAWHQMIRHTAWVFQEIAEGVDGLAVGTDRALDRMRRETIPALIAASLLGPMAAIRLLQAQVKALEGTAAHVARVPAKVITHTVERVSTIEHTITKVVVRTAAPAIAKGLAVPWGQIRGLERDVTGLEKWVRAHRKAVTEATILGVTLAVLSRLKLGWLRCSNVAKAGRNVCGMDAGLLEALLADSLLIFGTLSLVEFAETMLAGMEEMSAGVFAGWRETAKIQPLTFTGYTGTLG